MSRSVSLIMRLGRAIVEFWGVYEGVSMIFGIGRCGFYLGEYLLVRYRVVVALAFERVAYRRVVVG
jgi:hypothetical protein